MIKQLFKRTFELWCQMHWLRQIDKEIKKIHKYNQKTKKYNNKANHHCYVMKELQKEYNKIYLCGKGGENND